MWSEIDLDAQTVTFTHQLSKGERVALKTKRSRRCVEITPELTSKLRAAKLARHRLFADHAYVFVTSNGTPHDHRNIAGRVLARAVKRAELGAVERNGHVVEHSPTFHNLRHTHGSALIAARMGHRGSVSEARPRGCGRHDGRLRPRVRRGSTH